MKKKLLRTRVGNTNLAAALAHQRPKVAEDKNRSRLELENKEPSVRDETFVKAAIDKPSVDHVNRRLGIVRPVKRPSGSRSVDNQKTSQDGAKSYMLRTGRTHDLRFTDRFGYLTKLSKDPLMAKGELFTNPDRSMSVDKREYLENKRLLGALPPRSNGKLSEIIAALSQLHQKLGSTHHLRMYLQKWASPTDSSVVVVPNFVRSLELMGYNVTKEQAEAFARYIQEPEDHQIEGQAISSADRIPLKKLPLVAALAQNPAFKYKLETGTDWNEVRDHVNKLDKERVQVLDERLFKWRFCKYKDQIVNSLKDEEDLNEDKIFTIISHLGFNLQTTDAKLRSRFVADYVDEQGRFKTKPFYEDMNEILPNATRNVSQCNLAAVETRGKGGGDSESRQRVANLER